MFAKMASPDPEHRAAIGATGMGTREARFYDELAPSIKMRIPASYFARSGDDGAFLMLLEDLQAIGASMSDGTWGIPADLAAGALSDLARLHVSFEDRRPARGDPSLGHGDAGDVIGLHEASAATRDRRERRRALGGLHRRRRDVPRRLRRAHRAVGATDRRRSSTATPHIGNLFIDDGRVGFLDWGLMTISTPMRDVSYFITMSMLADERRKHERDLLQHYLDTRRSLGGTEISADDAWQAHRVHTAYTVLASFLSLVPPYNGEDQREFSDAFRNRAITALDDLETVPALKSLLA